EWIELKNISGEEIDLVGWKVLNSNNQINIIFETGTILNNGYLLLERTDDDSVPGISADLIYSGGLNNTNEFLYLFNADCGLEDEVTANPNWPAGDNGSKRTMERTDNLTWQTSANVGGTPRAENSPGYYDSGGSGGSSGGGATPSSSSVSYPALLITEVQLADSESQKSEFVELYNPNDSDVDLTNWYVQRKTENATSFSTFASKTLFSGKNVQARDYFLIAREGSRFVGLADIITTYALTENNTLVLKNPNKEIVDKLGWGSANDFEASPTQNPQIGQSVGRKWVGGEYQDANNNSKDFEVQIPTPKANNEIDLIAPQVEITSNPSNLTNQAEAIFTFQCSEENSYFECKINGADWESCVSPKTYQGLSDGEHTFSVRATDLFSNISLPTLYTWFIDTEIESPSIFLFDLDSDSQFYTNQSEVAIIAYATAQEDGINWFLSENDEKPTIQDSNWRQENPETFILSSGDGSKTVYIWTKDEAENISQLGNSSSIILDTGSPSVQIFELEPWQRISVFSVSWVGSDLLSGIGDFNVQYATGALDGVWLDLAQETQNNSIEFSGQDGLAYYFRVDARDGAGNESSWSEIFSTRIDINPPVVSFDVSPVQADPVFNLSWEVEDYVSSALEEATPSGIDGIYLQYSVVPAKEGIFLQYQENGSFQDWQIGEILELEESQTQLLVNGQDETTYIFSIQVIDKAGNITDWTEAQTRVKILKTLLLR
ncbi:lamin tail domain-containing protein, partial [Patescibacteria group bacterium]|nr:lamin tail domain-containing protein [Patescibacteria group bacterium]